MPLLGPTQWTRLRTISYLLLRVGTFVPLYHDNVSEALLALLDCQFDNVEVRWTKPPLLRGFFRLVARSTIIIYRDLSISRPRDLNSTASTCRTSTPQSRHTAPDRYLDIAISAYHLGILRDGIQFSANLK